MMSSQRISFLHVSNKLVIACLPRLISPIFSSFLIFYLYNKLAKYEKLGKYWSYCAQNCAITDLYKKPCPALIKNVTETIINSDANLFDKS